MNATVKQILSFILSLAIAVFFSVTTQAGGISDGGGNAVGGTVFDFYENEGSTEATHEQIINWNTETTHIVAKANALVPQVGEQSSRGLGDVLIQAIKSRKWILEPKPITKESCKNDSIVATVNQKIVGCQNFYEARLSVTWLKEEARNAKNQAGLIIHEAILMWLRDTQTELSKADLEYSAREINRLLFSDIDSPSFVQQISGLVRKVVFYNQQESAFEKSLPLEALKIKINFCSNNSVDDYTKVLALTAQYPKSYNTINTAFKMYLDSIRLQTLIDTKIKLSQDVSRDQSTLNAMKKDYCSESREELPDVSQLKFNPKMLNNNCRERLDKTFDHYLKITTNEELKTSSQENRVKNFGVLSLVQTTAIYCAGIKGIELQRTTFWPFMTETKGRAIMKETELQAIKYFMMLKEAYTQNNFKKN